MRKARQKTLSKSVALEGIGLHTGMPCRAFIRPAPADSGIRFVCGRNGELNQPAIAARVENVFDTRLGTSLRSRDSKVARTIEHLMAACALAGIDNVDIEIDGPELPILDGSAAPFAEAMLQAGAIEQDAPRRLLRVTAPFELRDGERFIKASPHDGRIIEIAIEFDEAVIGEQTARLDLDDDISVRRLSSARTFCRLADVDAMRSAGLALGGSLDNAIVVDGERILNDSGLRDPDEFALHKALDLVGDLALAGAPIIGRIEAVRPGHDLNVRFVAGLLAAACCIEWV